MGDTFFALIVVVIFGLGMLTGGCLTLLILTWRSNW